MFTILYFVGLLIQIGHINLFTVVSKKILHTFQNSSKQEVLRSFYQYGNGRLCLRLQILCISVWLKSLLMYYSQNTFSSLLTDIWMIIQNPGYST